MTLKVDHDPRAVAGLRELRDACLEFHGTRASNGYGVVGLTHDGSRRQYKAHRLVWEVVHGPIPDGMVVCHRCDNPPCINIDHLFLGTHADNVRDRVIKGRTKGAPKGSLHHSARITESDVVVIRERVKAGERHAAVARSLGISDGIVNRVINGQSWGHVSNGGDQ